MNAPGRSRYDHGHRCIVNGNVFLGRQQRWHRRKCGSLASLTPSSTTTLKACEVDAERAALSMMNGITDSPLNGYSPVRNALVAHNTFVDCKVSLEIGVGAGEQQSVAPADCRITHNVFPA